MEVVIPDDLPGNPKYQVTSEEDINIGNGEPDHPAGAAAGVCRPAAHRVTSPATRPTATPPCRGHGTNGAPSGVIVPASTPTDNPTFLDIGGSPYEGTQKPLCDTKLVELNNGKSIVPTFNFFTDVPLPVRLRGLLVDDLQYSSDPQSTAVRREAGHSVRASGHLRLHEPHGATVESDFNGIYDVLMPSTNHINCPTPSGVCAGMYRFVGNDPGIPGRLNPNYNPDYRTIATEFEAFPGLTIPTDLAPTAVGNNIASPAGQMHTVNCALDTATPQIFAVSQPYVNNTGSFSITGLGFGATKGTGQVMLDGVNLPTGTWNDRSITGVTVGSSIARARTSCRSGRATGRPRSTA